VQGVGYRYSTHEMAERLGLGGWVRNLPDGRVEAVFEGPPTDVARAISWCRQGPPGAWVSDVRTETEDVVGDGQFDVRSTRAWGVDT
jgi:acylphosphatase